MHIFSSFSMNKFIYIKQVIILNTYESYFRKIIKIFFVELIKFLRKVKESHFFIFCVSKVTFLE